MNENQNPVVEDVCKFGICEAIVSGFALVGVISSAVLAYKGGKKAVEFTKNKRALAIETAEETSSEEN